jgi:hypothetical protein
MATTQMNATDVNGLKRAGSVTDTLIGKKAYGQYINNAAIDIAHGGQFGYAPNMTEWKSNQAYVRKSGFAVLLEVPKFFLVMPDPESWIQALKALLETQSKKIEGFKQGVKLEVEEHDFGAAGEKQQEVVNATRERSEPTITVQEKYGRPIQTFINAWMRYGLMDPETKYALISTLAKKEQIPDDLLADWYSCSWAFIEPDPTGRKVVKSYLVANSWPMEEGDVESVKDPVSSQEMLELTIPFSGITQVGVGVNIFCQQLLDKMNRINANPFLRAAYTADLYKGDELKESAVLQLDTTLGYSKSMDDVATSAAVTLETLAAAK